MEQQENNYLHSNIDSNPKLDTTEYDEQVAKYFWSLTRANRRKLLKKEAKWKYYVQQAMKNKKDDTTT